MASMRQDSAVDGFRLAYDRAGQHPQGPAVVLRHGGSPYRRRCSGPPTTRSLFPRAWSDRIGEFFAAATLTPLDGVGHFVPLECPEAFASAVIAAAGRPGRRAR